MISFCVLEELLASIQFVLVMVHDTEEGNYLPAGAEIILDHTTVEVLPVVRMPP